MNNSKEIWKDVQDYDGRYRVSNLGRVKSIRTFKNVRNNTIHVQSKVLKPQANNSGYLFVMLHKSGKYKHCYLHRLVAEAFILNPNRFPTVNHIDGNKENNKVTNLEWASYSANNKHAYNCGLTHSNKNNPHMSKKVQAYSKNGKLLYEFPSMREAERRLNLANGTVHMAIKKGWQYDGLVWKLAK